MRVGGLTFSTVNLRGYDGAAWQSLKVDPSIHLLVNIGGLSALATSQVGMTDSATLILAANTSRKSASIKNIGANDVDIGLAGVTFGTGWRLKPGEALGDIRTTGLIRGICDTGLTSTVCTWEE